MMEVSLLIILIQIACISTINFWSLVGILEIVTSSIILLKCSRNFNRAVIRSYIDFLNIEAPLFNKLELI